MNPRTLLGVGLVVVGLSLNYRLATLVRPDLAAPVGMTRQQQEKLEQLATASLFGQFRSSMADFLWMKVDKYLHNGVDLRGLTEEEKRTLRYGQISNKAGEEGRDLRQHSNETTLVLAPEYDWRGRLGDVEREIKPYRNMKNHAHRDPKEALPLFRLMTWSNPHFIPGYAVGAAMIAREEKAFDEAIKFIEEGERNNPDSVEIQNTFAWLLMHGSYFNGRDDYAAAVAHAEKGIAAIKKRDPATLTEDERTAWQDVVRWRVLGYRELGKIPEAIRAAEEGLTFFPNDITCRRFLSEQASRKGATKTTP